MVAWWLYFFHHCNRRLLSIEKVNERIYGTPIFTLSFEKKQLPVLLNTINRHSFNVYICINKFKRVKSSPAEYFILLLTKNIYVTTSYWKIIQHFKLFFRIIRQQIKQTYTHSCSKAILSLRWSCLYCSLGQWLWCITIKKLKIKPILLDQS